MSRKDEVTRNLREKENYVIGYRASKYIRRKFANLLEDGEFMELSEVINNCSFRMAFLAGGENYLQREKDP